MKVMNIYCGSFQFDFTAFSSNGCREDTPLRHMSTNNSHSAVIETSTNADNEPDAVALL